MPAIPRRAPALISLMLVAVGGRRSVAQASGAWVVAPRYASDGEGAIFAGRVSNSWIVAEEFTFDVRDGGWALGVGAGPRFGGVTLGLTTLVGPVYAAPSWYAGLYVAPAWRTGRFTAGGTIEIFIPTRRNDALVYELSHARLLFRATHDVRIGVFIHLEREGSVWDRAQAGPSLRFGLGPELTLTADVARGFAGTPSMVLASIEWSRH